MEGREEKEIREKDREQSGRRGKMDECAVQYVWEKERWEREAGRQRGTEGFLIL